MDSHPTRALANSRRQFLQTTVAATVATGFGPLILGAEDKSGSGTPTVGAGEFSYTCEHDWGAAALPADHHYGNASHGVTVDKAGRIYITHQGNPGSIFVFDPDGKFVRAMGEVHFNKRGEGHGIDIRQEGNEEFLYLSPSNANLAFTKMTLDGEVVWQKNRSTISKESGGVLDNPKIRFRPTNTSFRPDGGYYLGDGYGSHFVFEYDRNDRFVRVLGGPGKTAGKFSTPHGQWLDERDGTPKLVVADRANKRLQWFDMEGKHLKTLDGFLFPADIDIQGEWMLVPDLHARVTILNAANEVVAQLGDDEAWRAQVLGKGMSMRGKRPQWQPGKFVHPHDACFDADGNIFVAEWVATGRVTKLTRV